MFQKTISRIAVVGLLIGATALPVFAAGKAGGSMMSSKMNSKMTKGKPMAALASDKMMMNRMTMHMSATDKKTWMGMSMAEKRLVIKMMRSSKMTGGSKMMGSKKMHHGNMMNNKMMNNKMMKGGKM